QQECGFGDDDFVLERIALSAESAAVGSGDHANMRGRNLEDFRESAVKIVGSLRAGPDGEFTFGIFCGKCGVLFDGEMSAALIEKSILEDFVGFVEAGVDVAEFERDALVNIS